jgi:hypothetical protein
LNFGRADLCIEATDSEGLPHRVLIEVKVNDAPKDHQLRELAAATGHAVVYAPGTTGLLHAHKQPPVAGVPWVTGEEVVAAFRGVHLPRMVATYLETVSIEADRMTRARRAAQNRNNSFPENPQATGVSDHLVESRAWLGEVDREMARKGAQRHWPQIRARNDGLWWQDSMRNSLGTQIYVDVVVSRAGDFRVTVKMGERGDGAARLALREAALTAGPPSEGWKAAPRKATGQNSRLWVLDANALTASETARAAFEAKAWIERFAAEHPG